MLEYKNLLNHILHNGVASDDRTGVGTISTFGYQNRYDLNKGFPIVTVKKVPFRLVVTELLWFLSGDTHVARLQDQNNHIWDEWATPDQTLRWGRESGDLGPIYGWQWRHFGGDYSSKSGGFDQIQWLVNEIRQNPNSRRLIVSGWNPEDAGKVALPPCHTFFHCYQRQGKLSLQLYQRSADSFLGVPFNIASYALLTHMIAHVCGLEVGEFIHSFGDLHIYKNHLEQVNTVLSREPMPLPILELNPELKGKGFEGLMAFKTEDIKLIKYVSHEAVKAPVAV